MPSPSFKHNLLQGALIGLLSACSAPDAETSTTEPSSSSGVTARPSDRVRAIAEAPSDATPRSPIATTTPDRQSSLRADDVAPATPRAEVEELIRRLEPGLSRSSAGLEWVDVGGGVRSMDLRGRFQHAMIAVRGGDGVVRSTCVDGLDAAKAVLQRAQGREP